MRKLANVSLVIVALSLSACGGGNEAEEVVSSEDARARRCGTIAGIACPRGSYCDFGAGQCNVADAAGVCRAIPRACTTDYAPVCGCDGTTYSNGCEAARAGVGVDHAGACVPPPVVCGGIAGLACAEGQFCRYAEGACRTPDATGVCEPRPAACTTEYVPVCGCDGKTYSNACAAAMAGVSVASAGACALPPGACGGTTGAVCPAGQFCRFATGQCRTPGAVGQCAPTGGFCTTEYDPVCGCDGFTYSNACWAQIAGVNVAHLGACLR